MRSLFSVFNFILLASFIQVHAEPQGLQFVRIGKTSVQVEIVRKPEDWMKGLMYREHLGEHEGMLFFGQTERPQSFWMKNTLISLDIVFISKKLKIVSIQKNAVPLSEKALPSEGPAIHVLEVPGGSADRWGWKAGDSVKFIGF